MKDKDTSKWQKFTEEQIEPLDDDKPQVSEDLLKSPEDLGLEFSDRNKLEDQLTAAEQALFEYKDKNLRLMAQVKNIQERADRDVSKAHKYGAEKLLLDLLPVVDSLSRGLENINSEGESLKAGLQMTLDLLIKTLIRHGVEVINPASGDVFNPELHEAMTMQQGSGSPSNTVLQVLQQGYQLNGRVLRAAMVIVAG